MSLKLDLCAPSKGEMIGYGAAYHSIRRSIQRLNGEYPGIRLRDNYAGGDVQVFVGSPWKENEEYYPRKADRFIIFTMFESSEIPTEWIEQLQQFDEIIVPCEWNKAVFERCGVKQKIHVIPLGIDPEKWPLLERRRKPTEKYNIFWQGTHAASFTQPEGDRKGSVIVQQVFDKLGLPNCKLTIKVNPKYMKYGTRWDLELRLDGSLRSIGMLYEYDKMLELLQSMDLSIYPSYGEGFGLIPMEHMATGLPVIISNNTGMSQFCDRLYNLPVECETIDSKYGRECGDSYWPNVEQIEAYFLYAYENRKEMIEMGRQASEWIHREWTTDRTARMILDLAKEGDLVKVG